MDIYPPERPPEEEAPASPVQPPEHPPEEEVPTSPAQPPDRPPDVPPGVGETLSRWRDAPLPTWGIPVGAGLLLLVLVVAALVFTGALTPSGPRCLPANQIPAAAEGEHLIVVTEFTGTGGIDPATSLRKALAGRDDFRVAQACDEILEAAGARALGDRLGAAGVLWGTFDVRGITTHVEWLQQPNTLRDEQDFSVPPLLPDAYVLALSTDPGPDLPFVRGMVGGHVAALNFDLARAQSELEAALASLPTGTSRDDQTRLDQNAAAARFALGATRLALSDAPEEALEDFDWAIELDETYADAYYNRGVAHYLMGELDALADFTQVIEFESSNAAAFNARGATYVLLGDYEAAIADLDQAIALDGELTGAYNNRGTARFMNGEVQEAIADFTLAIALDTSYTPAYKNRGVAYFVSGDAEAAIEDYGMALALDPQYEDAYYNRGLAYFELGDYHEAVADFNRALLGDPTALDTYFNRGSASYLTGDYLSAISDFTTVLAEQPENAEAYVYRGNAYFGRRNYAAADADYTAALALDADNADAYFNRGFIRHNHLKAYDAAVDDYTAAIENGYDQADVYLERAELLFFLLGKAGVSLPDYEEALERDPSLETVQRGYALALFEVERYEDSAEAWRAALDLNAFQAEYHAGLAIALDALEDRDGALAAYRQALELDEDLTQAATLASEFAWTEKAVTAASELVEPLQEALAEEEAALEEEAAQEEEAETPE